MQTRYFNSIFKINYVILLFLLFWNLAFYFIEWLYRYKSHFLIYNLLLLAIFLLSNLLYKREYNNEKWNLKDLMNINFWDSNSLKETFVKKLKYKENEEINNLFKKFFIKKSIINKDYVDLKNIFFKMVPEHFIAEVGESWIDRISLWVSLKKSLIVMFIDIIWFTSIAEKLPQDKTLLLLNIYFDWIVEIIKKYWWNVDKFLWDWMMVVFDNNNMNNSINTAIDIQEFFKKVQIKEIWKKIEIWIWINFWEVILWTIWNKKRMEITLIWDVVNTASRIQWLTRFYKEKILFSESVYNLIENNEKFNISNLWYKTLKWKKNKINIYWI